MAEATDTLGILYQNLLDAGCNKELIEKCMLLARKNRQTDILPLLSHHRKELLNDVHQSQKCIDCLDFLAFQIKKQANKK